MNKIDTCLSPEMIGLFENLEDKIIVVADIFRATSCIVSGMATGVKSIIPVASVEECRALGQQGYITAGERQGIKIEDFHFGNSPYSYMSDTAKGQSIAMTTTNGTRAIDCSKGAKQVVIGAFLNLQAIANYLIEQQSDVILFSAGWRGRFSMEDTLFTGALTDILVHHQFEPLFDDTLAAWQLYQQAKGDLTGYLANANHVQRLQRLGNERDIEFCLRIDEFDVVPILKGRELFPLGK
ncbi:MAG: 2-phosphosulfolactate phosphatase [Flammeovirgaceae bacterium]